MVWAFIFTPPITNPVQPVVQVSLRQPATPPPVPPPPVALVTPRVPTIQPPLVVMDRPPPPSPNAPVVTYGLPSPPMVVPGPVQTAPPSDYLKRLVAYLNAYKNYPPEARRRREQGVVRLHFIMDRSGRVLSYNVTGSSGSAALDEAARALIRRAQPLPPVPPDYPGATLDLIVPVVFSLR